MRRIYYWIIPYCDDPNVDHSYGVWGDWRDYIYHARSVISRRSLSKRVIGETNGRSNQPIYPPSQLARAVLPRPGEVYPVH